MVSDEPIVNLNDGPKNGAGRGHYRHIFVAVDNSEQSNVAIDVAVALAKACGARLTGCHVYAALLHARRFIQLEPTLPDEYQDEAALQKQREIHDSLIGSGLQLIANSYLDVFEARCREANVPFDRLVPEGKNYAVLLREIERTECDLVVLGATGLGDLDDGALGSVCERVLRQADTDLLVIRNSRRKPGRITVGIDGSELALAGFRTALALGDALETPVDAVAAFDADFHVVAFRSIEKVLSAEAGKLFRIKEQEKLHTDVIDRGLGRIYSDHLKEAALVAKEADLELSTKLLSGKPYAVVLEHLQANDTWLAVIGRSGVHAQSDGVMGANTDKLTRMAPCHVLVVANRQLETPDALSLTDGLPWTEEAEARLERVPAGFMRQAMRRRIVGLAESQEAARVELGLVEEAIARGREAMMGKSPSDT